MVLLTGATGFLGSFVLDELLRLGYEVIAPIRSEIRVTKRSSRVKWVRADLGKANQWKNLPTPDEGIIHLASTLSLKPSVVTKVDIPGMWTLLNKWGEGPFLFVSSTDVYGRLKVVPADENHPLEPTNWYGFGKLVCEHQLRMMARMKNRADFAVFRSPYIVGPHRKFPLSLIGKLITCAMAGKDFVLPEQQISGTANPGHSWVSAYDLAIWIVTALKTGINGTYNASSGFVTWENLLKLILKTTGNSGRVFFRGRGDRTMGLCDEPRWFSNERLRELFQVKHNAHLEPVLTRAIEETFSFAKKGVRLNVAKGLFSWPITLSSATFMKASIVWRSQESGFLRSYGSAPYLVACSSSSPLESRPPGPVTSFLSSKRKTFLSIPEKRRL